MTQDTVTLEVVILLAILLEQNVSQPLFLTDKYHENLIFAHLVSKLPTIHGAIIIIIIIMFKKSCHWTLS